MQERLSSFDAEDVWAAIEHFLSGDMSDGLPVVPPTVDLVGRFLGHVNLKRDDEIARVSSREIVLTAEMVAINAVMAGCRPDYLPVVIAAVEAICDESFNINGASVSTGGSAQLVIVNGPVAGQIGMNSGTNAFGPGNRANATIGRAVRLIVINAIGSIPGIVDLSCLGHPGKYTYCIAEAEDVSPWDPLHVEQGYLFEDSTVTVVSSQSGHQVHDYDGNDGAILAIGDAMGACGSGFGGFTVVMGPESATLLAGEGLSKEQVKEALRERIQQGSGEEILRQGSQIMLVVAGGLAGRFSAIMPPWAKGLASQPVTRKIAT